jgi:hypothetical protein
MTFDVKEAHVDLGADFSIVGQSDMAKIVENTLDMILDLIIGRMKSYTQHHMIDLKAEIEPVLNSLFTLPSQVDLGGGWMFKGGFVAEPGLGDGWVTLPIEYFFATDKHNYPGKNDIKMPLHSSPDKENF